jgi:hypothetical protein
MLEASNAQSSRTFKIIQAIESVINASHKETVVVLEQVETELADYDLPDILFAHEMLEYRFKESENGLERSNSWTDSLTIVAGGSILLGIIVRGGNILLASFWVSFGAVVTIYNLYQRSQAAREYGLSSKLVFLINKIIETK